MRTPLISIITVFFILSFIQTIHAQQGPIPVIVKEATSLKWVDEIEALGTLRANEEVTITANVTEKVSAIHFEDGDIAEKDQILVEMTSAEERALLDEARATMKEARQQLERVRPLVEKKTASEALLDQREREYQTAKARLAAIESQMEDRLIKAPFAGQLGFREISVGALVTPGTVVTTLDDIDPLKLDFTVPSLFLSKLKKGDMIEARADAFDGEIFKGQIDTVGTRINPNTRAVTYRALIDNPEQKLKPGLLMRLNLIARERQVVTIPEAAVKPYGDKFFAYVVVQGEGDSYSVEEREIKKGERRVGAVEVLEGVKAGELIVAQGVMKVKDGASVRIAGQLDDQTQVEDILNKSPNNPANQTNQSGNK